MAYAKSLLQEFCLKNKLPLPVYDTHASGPPHSRAFRSVVKVADQSFSGMDSKTKKAAEHSVAEIAHRELGALVERMRAARAEGLAKGQPPPDFGKLTHLVVEKPSASTSAKRPRDSKNETCPYFASGHCRFGNRCSFTHDPASKKARFAANPANLSVLKTPGDTRAILNQISHLTTLLTSEDPVEFGEIEDIANDLDLRMSAKLVSLLPSDELNEHLTSTINKVNHILGMLRLEHSLAEFKIVGLYALGLMSTGEKSLDSVVVFAKPPHKEDVKSLGLALAPHFPYCSVQQIGSMLRLVDDRFTFNLYTAYKSAWDDDPRLSQDAASPLHGVDIEGARRALSMVRFLIWLEPELDAMPGPSPRIVSQLFRTLVRSCDYLKDATDLEIFAILHHVLTKKTAVSGLSNTIMNVLKFLASGSLYPLGGSFIRNPTREFDMNLFSTLTRDEENSLLQHHRALSKALPPPLSSGEVEALISKAKLVSVPRADLFIRFAQELLRALAVDSESTWQQVLGGLPAVESLRKEAELEIASPPGDSIMDVGVVDDSGSATAADPSIVHVKSEPEPLATPSVETQLPNEEMTAGIPSEPLQQSEGQV